MKFNQCFMKFFLSVFVSIFFLSGHLYGQIGDPNDLFGPGGTGEADGGGFVGSGTQKFYVKSGNSSGNGLSWGTAFNNLQDALDAAQSDDEIWVAAGTYWPTKMINEKSSYEYSFAFVLKTNNVKIYGGFPATGNPTMDDRNWTKHKTILSGDIGKDDRDDGEIIGVNASHVVISLATDVLLDGFTISGGDASHSSVAIVGSHEIGDFNGGGIWNASSSKLVLKNSIVKANRAAFDGGGIYNHDLSVSEFVNVQICGNIVTNGGGGGVTNRQSASEFVNVLIFGNTANYGGGIYNQYADVKLTNVTISGNYSGGMESDNSSTQLYNTIIMGNGDPNDLYDNCQHNYNHSLIRDRFYTNNENFERWGGVELLPSDIFMGWVAPTNEPTCLGNYRLKAGGLAIDAGKNDYVNEATDPNGKPRIMGGTVDLGAFEFYYMTELELTVNGLPENFDKNDLKINFYKSDGTQVWELESGEYRVSVDYPGFFMTYYNEDRKQATTWKDATPIIVAQAYYADQVIPVTVTLIPEETLETGTFTLSGALGLADNNISSTSKIRPIANLNGNVSLYKSTVAKSDGYVLIKTVQTTDGHYSFTNLPEGNYRIIADIPGYESGAVDVHLKGMKTVNFIINAETKTIIAETVTEAPSWQARNIKVYPNPAVDILHVSGLEGVYSAKIVNILGQILYSATGSSAELLLNVGHLPSGMYFLRIESGKAITTRKIIKQ